MMRVLFAHISAQKALDSTAQGGIGHPHYSAAAMHPLLLIVTGPHPTGDTFIPSRLCASDIS
jgi:hypothetical protein